MILQKYIAYIICSCGLGFVSCSDTAIPAEETVDVSATANSTIQNTPYSNEVLFEGNLIHLEEEGQADEIYTIPEISHQKDDITFTAKRIPTELYLKNSGVTAADLEKALADTKGEQLFYFEFQEEQKQDLIKKYLEDDLDANISYLSFSIFNDFSVITSQGDTIPAEYSLYERNYHVAPYERVIVSFTGVDQDEQLQLIYNDKLFGKGEMDFTFAPTSYLENNIKNPA